MTDWLKEAQQLQEELVTIRRDIHMHPEQGNREFRTSAFIEQYLNDLGIETERMLDTAVIGTLKGAQDGKTAAIRSDMDALPVTEKTGLPFASVNEGTMHACGPDMHAAALLGAAKLLSRHRDELSGTVKFFFQPDEEEDGGAQRMIAAGALNGVDAVFGAHVNPELPAGTVGIRYGKFYASAMKFDVTVHGRGTHGAEPENGIDPLYAAARMCAALKELTGDFDGERAVVTVGALHCGTVRNIISDTASFIGIIRVLGADSKAKMKTIFLETIRKIEEETGAEAEVNLVEGYIGIVNHDRETAHAETCARQLLGSDRVIRIEKPTMTTEDFGYFIEHTPGCFYHFGVNCPYPLHSPHFDPDESGLASAAAFHAYNVFEYLKSTE